MIKEIKTIQDVKNFASHLVHVEKLSFHPDDDFRDYVNLQTQKAFYTESEALVRNKLMDACFEVCNRNDVDIYEILLPIILSD